MSDTTRSWDILDTESSAAYDAFSAYLGMPRRDRSLLAAYRLQPGHAQAENVPGQWNAWSRAHRWTERARAWDAHQLTVKREAQAEADVVAIERLDKLALGLLGKAALALNETKPKAVKPYAIVQMSKVASEIIHANRAARAEIADANPETLPTDGYDVLDSLRSNRDFAPLLVRIQDLGVGLEPDPGEHGDDPVSGEVDA